MIFMFFLLLLVQYMAAVAATTYPVVGPTDLISCDYYSANNTSFDTENFATCGFSACGGTTVLISGCDCSGDQYLRLMNSSGIEVAANDDNCDLCSYITYAVPGDGSECLNFTIQEGCFSTRSCNGTVTVSGNEIPSESPTFAPTYNLTGSVSCPSYSVSNSILATENYDICEFTACGGDTIIADACNCTGDTYLILNNGTSQVAFNDDAHNCGYCSVLTYTIPGLASDCRTYSLQEGCYEAESCSATVAVAGSSVNKSTEIIFPLIGSSTSMSCVPYTASDTNSATQNYATCGFSACGGTSITISGCDCVDDQYLRLYQGSSLLLSDDDYCEDCSYISFIVSGDSSECFDYTIQEGCWSSTTCSGTVIVSAEGFPSEAPAIVPTSFPSSAGTVNCPYYSATNTNYASQNYAICEFTACGGDTITADGCGCSGDQYLALYFGDTQLVTDDDSSCGICSMITYTVPGTSTDCSTFSLQEGCFSSGSCSGTVSLTGSTIDVNTSTANVYPLVGTSTTLSCVPYEATNTNTNTQNYASCGFSACGGTTVTVSGCNCLGDQFLSVYQGSTLVASDDDSCNGCSLTVFTVSGDGCYDYVIHEGCFSSTTCSGTVAVTGSSLSTVIPGAEPTPAPTQAITCPAYSATDTNSASQNYDTCSFTACGGSTITASACGCTGDTYLILYNAQGSLVFDDDSTCGTCSILSYSVPGSSSDCYTYSLHEGCFSQGSCSATVTVAGVTIDTNTTSSTTYPLVGPTTSMSCAEYSASSTNSATTNYVTCGFSACGGTTVTISGCGCYGDQYLALYEGSSLLSSSDDFCNQCSYISYTVPGSSSSCYDYNLREGCFSSSSCSGTVSVSGSLSSSGGTSTPTSIPTTHTSSFYCPYYSASNTNSDTQNYDVCSFYACGGDTISVDGCGCSGDQYLKLYSGYSVVAYDDDSSFCGTCSVLSYTVPGSSSSCSTYDLHEGCYSSASCSGSVLVSGVTALTDDNSVTTDDDADDDTQDSASTVVNSIIIPVAVVSFVILVGFFVYLCYANKKSRSDAYIPSTHEVEMANA